MPWGEPVTVVNRTSKPLQFKFDGVTNTLKPGENPGIYESLAGFAKSKFPIMGTEDPYNPIDFDCLIGVKEWGDICDPIEQSDAVERLDRSKLPEPILKDGARGKVVSGPRNQYRPMPQEAAKNHTEFRE